MAALRRALFFIALLFAASSAQAQFPGGGGTTSFPAYIDTSPTGTLMTGITAPLAAQAGHSVDVGAVELLQTSPTGGNITAADSATTTTTSGSQGGQGIVTGTPTTNSYITFIFPNAEGAANFNVTGLTALTTGGAMLSECSPDNNNFSPCAISIPGQADTTSITGNVIGGVVNVVGAKYWRLRNTGTLTGTAAVTATLTTGVVSKQTAPLLSTPNGSGQAAGDTANNTLWMPGLNYTTGPVWNVASGTPTLTISNLQGAPEIIVEFETSTCTSPTGTITGQTSYDNGATWINWATSSVRTPTNGAPAGPTFNFATVGASSNLILLIETKSASQVRLNNGGLGGTGTCAVSVFYQLLPQIVLPLSVGSSTIVPTTQTYIQQMSQYPVSGGGAGTAPVAAKGTGSTGAVTATLAATSGVTNYVCHVDFSGVGTAAATIAGTITGLSGGTWTYQLAIGTVPTTLTIPINPCVPASGTNVAIVAGTAADATGTAVDVNISGYQQ